MEQYYNWCMSHQMLCGVAGCAIAILLGLIKLDKVKMFAFTFSQLIRKTLGRKVEQKVEDIVHAIDEGLKSDNEGQSENDSKK